MSATRNSTPSSVGLPSGERAASAVTNSASNAARRRASSSGLVKTSATFGASSSSPRLVERGAAACSVHSQPSMPSLRGITRVGAQRGAGPGSGRASPDAVAGPGSTVATFTGAERQLERRVQHAAVLDRHAGARAAAAGRARSRAACASRASSRGRGRARARAAGGAGSAGAGTDIAPVASARAVVITSAGGQPSGRRSAQSAPLGAEERGEPLGLRLGARALPAAKPPNGASVTRSASPFAACARRPAIRPSTRSTGREPALRAVDARAVARRPARRRRRAAPRRRSGRRPGSSRTTPAGSAAAASSTSAASIQPRSPSTSTSSTSSPSACEPAPRLGGRRHPEPALELLARRGAVRAQVGAGRRSCAAARPSAGVREPVEPVRRAREAHALAVARREAEVAGERGGLEQVAEAAARASPPAPASPTRAATRRRRARRASAAAPASASGDRGEHRLGLLARDAVVRAATRARGGAAAGAPARRCSAASSSARSRCSVPRIAHVLTSVRALPQRSATSARFEPVDPRPQRQLGATTSPARAARRCPRPRRAPGAVDTRSARCWRRIRQASTESQVSRAKRRSL